MLLTKPVLLLRGHVRHSLDTSHLRDLVTQLVKAIPQLSICIHTWDQKASSISWRRVEEDTTVVTENLLRTYFGEGIRIHRILIESDRELPLVGNKLGSLVASNMPLRGWKNYLYGQYHGVHRLHEEGIARHTRVASMRFDVLKNSCPIAPSKIVAFLKAQLSSKDNQLKDEVTFALQSEDGIPQWGVDNLFAGSASAMHRLLHTLHFHLDELNAAHPALLNHEFLFALAANPETCILPPGSLLCAAGMARRSRNQQHPHPLCITRTSNQPTKQHVVQASNPVPQPTKQPERANNPAPQPTKQPVVQATNPAPQPDTAKNPANQAPPHTKTTQQTNSNRRIQATQKPNKPIHPTKQPLQQK